MAGLLAQSQLQKIMTFTGLKNVVFWYILWKYFIASYRHLCSRGLRKTVLEAYVQLANFGFRCALKLPSINRKVKSQLDAAAADMEKKLAPRGPGIVRWLELPETGKSADWLKDELESLSQLPSSDWKSGKVSGAVYHGGQDIEHVIITAINQYVISNPLHPDVFPGVRKMEAEVVRMLLDLFNAPNGAGTTTSGGTESIIMACKAYRDWAREVKGITEPEMVVPYSAHAAFVKGSEFLGIKIHHIRVDEHTRRVDISRVKRAINANTIMLVGSAPNYPDGAIDDIPALSRLAKKYNLGLHVDCCLGSLLVPFVEKCGFEMLPFDFRVEGVTSISCDPHKYGFAPKGSSVIMYRNSQWRQYQYTVYPLWPGGVFASPSAAGSRPGSVIAGTWAVMMHMGKEGYLESCRAIVGSAKKLQKVIREEIPELEVMGQPLVSVVAFTSAKGSGMNIYQLGDYLSSKGWHLVALQHPPGLHIACTRPTMSAIDTLIQDLKDGVASVKENKDGGKGQMVALYGLGTSSAVGPRLVSDLARRYLDTLYAA